MQVVVQYVSMIELEANVLVGIAAAQQPVTNVSLFSGDYVALKFTDKPVRKRLAMQVLEYRCFVRQGTCIVANQVVALTAKLAHLITFQFSNGVAMGYTRRRLSTILVVGSIDSFWPNANKSHRAPPPLPATNQKQSRPKAGFIIPPQATTHPRHFMHAAASFPTAITACSISGDHGLL
ncbi:hypothetical protein [Burkholderia stabilis]|uniref:hypothetical protein n=1 Tax=Burkholderia stabilis TaxID=95485 RepID=UPI0010137131|nr:hypothetical protein [Burkholderia stabilis]